MTPDSPAAPKRRHVCLTVYLLLVILANAAAMTLYLFDHVGLKKQLPQVPSWAFPVLTLIVTVNLLSGMALWKWKRWGFWGFAGAAVVTLVIGLAIGLSPLVAFGGILVVAVLYGAFQIGGEKKGWPQLD